jgi:hypothetical protein
MNKTIITLLIIVGIIGAISGSLIVIVSELQNSQKPFLRTIYVTIEPVANLNDTYAIYYDNYWDNLHWKKNIVVSNNMPDIIQEAISKANFVSLPVVIIAPKDFELEFKLTENMYPLYNEYGVTFQYYG